MHPENPFTNKSNLKATRKMLFHCKLVTHLTIYNSSITSNAYQQCNISKGLFFPLIYYKTARRASVVKRNITFSLFWTAHYKNSSESKYTNPLDTSTELEDATRWIWTTSVDHGWELALHWLKRRAANQAIRRLVWCRGQSSMTYHHGLPRLSGQGSDSFHILGPGGT